MKYPQEEIKPYNKKERKGKLVEEMFDNIAPSYDNLNRILSLGIDKSWRKKALRYLQPFQPKTMMDVATGTGDFALLAYKMLKPNQVIGVDISEGMMNVGRKKALEAGLHEQIKFAHEDCTSLSFENETYDAITVAFGIRNFENLEKGLSEMYRVLKPNGHLVILELTSPEYFPMKQAYHIYSKYIIPNVGKLLSKDRAAYTYLPQSIKAFPQGKVMKATLQKIGFKEVSIKPLTLGICTLYTATK